MQDFIASALIGHILVSNLIAKLVERKTLNPEDAYEIFDSALLTVETWQSQFPENDAAFSEARDYLERFARFFGQAIH